MNTEITSVALAGRFSFEVLVLMLSTSETFAFSVALLTIHSLLLGHSRLVAGGSGSTMVSKPLSLSPGTVSAKDAAVPENWAPQDTNCLVVDVQVESPEWVAVAQRFHASLKPHSYQLVRIERIQVG